MTAPDVASLKQEVAELWRRFKAEQPEVGTPVDPRRQEVLEATRLLEARQQALAARRDALEVALRRARAVDHSRRAGFTVLGVLVGAGLGWVALMAFAFEPLAAATIELPSAW